MFLKISGTSSLFFSQPQQIILKQIEKDSATEEKPKLGEGKKGNSYSHYSLICLSRIYNNKNGVGADKTQHFSPPLFFGFSGNKRVEERKGFCEPEIIIFYFLIKNIK